MRYSKSKIESPPPRPKPIVNKYGTPRKVKIIAEPSAYKGLELAAIGESEGLIVVPLPPIEGRPSYQGFFRAEHLDFEDEF